MERPRSQSRGSRGIFPAARALAALIALAAVLLASAHPAPAQTAVWSATLKVDRGGGLSGCDNNVAGLDSCSSATVLTDDDFTYGGTTYTVSGIYWSTSTKALELRISGLTGSRIKTALGALRLNVGGQWLVVNLSTATSSGIAWSYGPSNAPFASWTAGQRVSVSLTPRPAPAAPPSLKADSNRPNTIFLSWLWSNEGGRRRPDAFVLQVSEDGGASWTPLATVTRANYTHTGLAGGAVRHYRMKGRNTGGGVNVDGPWSSVASETALGVSAPAAPGGFTATAANRGVTLTWDNPNDPGITGWEYQQAPADVFGPWRAVRDSGAGTTSYTVTGLSPWISYAFRVRAVKGAVKGLPSASSMRVRPTGSGPPAGLTVPWDWAHLPKGPDGGPAFTDGESFRLLFITMSERDATSHDVEEYNRFVQAGAPTAGTRALISTRTVRARENTDTDTGAGVPIWWLGGDKVADGYADFWDGSWDSRASRGTHGDPRGRLVWTGSGPGGSQWLGGYAGSARVRMGWAGRAGGAVSLDRAPARYRYALYGLSPVIQGQGRAARARGARGARAAGVPVGGFLGPGAIVGRQPAGDVEPGRGPGLRLRLPGGVEEELRGRGRGVPLQRGAAHKGVGAQADPRDHRGSRAGHGVHGAGAPLGRAAPLAVVPGGGDDVHAACAGGAAGAGARASVGAGEGRGACASLRRGPRRDLAAGCRRVLRERGRERARRLFGGGERGPGDADAGFGGVGGRDGDGGLRAALLGRAAPFSDGGAAVAAFSGQAVANDTPAGQPQVQALQETVEPPEPLTARIEAAPPEHRGKGRFEVRVAFSSPVAGRARDAGVAVSGGKLARAARVKGRKDLWALRIEPSGHEAVTVTLPATADCAAAGAVCTADGRRLESRAHRHTVQGPPDAQRGGRAGEARVPDAAVDFAVTLSRAASGEVTVRYATRDGTAKKGKDYRRAKGALTFAAGETSEDGLGRPSSTTRMDEGAETFRLVL